MAQISINVPDEVYEVLRKRVTADVTITSQVNEAIALYLKKVAVGA